MIDQIDNNLSTKSDMSAEEFPGQILKQARENLKITQEEVAERLHLDIKIIRALENDNFAALPGRTYIKGYQRSYAILLGIPVKDISVAGEYVHHAQLMPENINYRNETKTRKFTYIWVSVVLLLILIIFSEYVHLNDTNLELQEHEVSSKKGTPTAVTARDNKAAKNDTETGLMPEVGMSAAVSQLQTENAVTKENTLVKFSGLVLKYEKSSWTEVYDANGKKLVFGMIKPGETIQVEGLQPFSVLLGNANEVKVEFDGKVFSTEKYIRNGMAQFVIGSSFNNKK